MQDTRIPPIEEQKRFWDWHWGNWKERGTLNEWKDRRHEEIISLIRSLSLQNPKILDLGCGPGHYTKNLALFGETTGIDLSEEAIQNAKAKYPNITFFAGNLYDYPLHEQYYDIVVSQEVFDHVEDQPAFLERVSCLLGPKGYLILSCTNKFVMDRLGSGKFPVQPGAHIAKYLDRKGLKRLLDPKFHMLRSKSIIPLGNGGILRVINSYKLNQIVESAFSRVFLESLKERMGVCYQLIVLARKKS